MLWCLSFWCFLTTLGFCSSTSASFFESLVVAWGSLGQWAKRFASSPAGWTAFMSYWFSWCFNASLFDVFSRPWDFDPRLLPRFLSLLSWPGVHLMDHSLLFAPPWWWVRLLLILWPWSWGWRPNPVISSFCLKICVPHTVLLSSSLLLVPFPGPTRGGNFTFLTLIAVWLISLGRSPTVFCTRLLGWPCLGMIWIRLVFVVRSLRP